MEEYAPDIIEAFAKIAANRKKKRAAAEAAEMAHLNAVERANNKATRVIDRSTGLPIFVPASESMDTSRYIAEMPELGTIVRQGEGGTEAKYKDLLFNLINQNPGGWQTESTTTNPRYDFIDTTMPDGHEMRTRRKDLQKDYDEGNPYPTLGMVKAPAKREIKTDPNSGQQYYSNEYTGRGDQVTPNLQTIQNIYNETGTDPEDIYRDYKLNIPTVGVKKKQVELKKAEEEFDFDKPETINVDGTKRFAQWDKKSGKYYDANSLKPIEGDKLKWGTFQHKSGKGDSRQLLHDDRGNVFITNNDGSRVDVTGQYEKIKDTTPVYSLFGEGRENKVLSDEFQLVRKNITSHLKQTDPTADGDKWLFAPFFSKASLDPDKLSEMGETLVKEGWRTREEMVNVKNSPEAMNEIRWDVLAKKGAITPSQLKILKAGKKKWEELTNKLPADSKWFDDNEKFGFPE